MGIVMAFPHIAPGHTHFISTLLNQHVCIMGYIMLFERTILFRPEKEQQYIGKRGFFKYSRRFKTVSIKHTTLRAKPTLVKN